MKTSRVLLILCFTFASLLLAFSVFAKSKGWNTAFNSCSKKMEDAYAECLNKPYNSVAMCQNVANGVYNRCMRSAGYYPRADEVPTVTGKPTGLNGGKTSSTPTPKPSFSPKIKPATDGISVTTLQSHSSPSPTPRPSTGPRKHKG